MCADGRLLAFLLLHRGRAIRRDEAATALWPELSRRAALDRLRRHVFLLHRQLPEHEPGRPWMTADRASVGWNPEADVWLDVADFEEDVAAAARAARELDTVAEEAALERALALYAGDLLADVDGEWAASERGRLRGLYRDVLQRRLVLRCAAGDVASASAAAQVLVRLEPLRENACRMAMGLLYLAGDGAAAVSAYERFRELLVERLDLEPTAETAQLAEAIKGSIPPEQVARLLQRDLPEALALRPHLGPLVRGNLPEPLTSFVGREPELATLAALVRRSKLVTLVGPGGCGKTRLALEAARDIAHRGGRVHRSAIRLADGVWWVELAGVADPDMFVHAVASTLGVAEDSDRDLAETLVQTVGPRRMLLVLDNCEHLVPAVRQLTEALSRRSFAVRVLATSRERLGARGERVLAVPPLSLPDSDVELAAASVARFEAPRLFAERAVRAWPGFRLADRNAPSVVRVCRRLDGLPLAIELAAARIRLLSADEIADRLDDRFGMLGAGARTEVPRHRTLFAAVGWSYDLLGEAERRVFRRLSVFRGGWVPGAAVAVCADDSAATDAVPELLAALVEKSLAVGRLDGEGRQGMLETVREYARERALESGDYEPSCRRHLTHYLGLAERAEARLRGPEQVAWLETLSVEHANLRAALAWAARQRGRAVVDGLRLAAALRWFWFFRGHLAEGRAWLERGLEAADEAPPALRSKALSADGTLALRQGRFTVAGELYSRSLAQAEQAGDRVAAGQVLGNLGLVLQHQGDLAAARRHLERSLEVLDECGDALGVANALANLGRIALQSHDLEAARRLSLRHLALRRESGDPWALASALRLLASVAATEGGLAEAVRLCDEALALLERVGDQGGVADVLNDLIDVLTWLGDYERAGRTAERSIALYGELGMDSGVAASLAQRGQLRRLQGDLGGAEADLQASLALYRRLGDERACWCVVAGLGEVASASGRWLRAARLLGAAVETGLAIDAHAPAGREDRARMMADAIEALGRSRFDEAAAEGRVWSFEEAMAYVAENDQDADESGSGRPVPTDRGSPRPHP